MAQEQKTKRVTNMTLEQIEREINSALDKAIPPDAIKNTPIREIEKAQTAALEDIGFDRASFPSIECTLVCTGTWPNGGVTCTLECKIVWSSSFKSISRS